MKFKPTDTSGLTREQKARLAYALSMIRETQTLRGWYQVRYGEAVRLLKRDKSGKLAQVYNI